MKIEMNEHRSGKEHVGDQLDTRISLGSHFKKKLGLFKYRIRKSDQHLFCEHDKCQYNQKHYKLYIFLIRTHLKAIM